MNTHYKCTSIHTVKQDQNGKDIPISFTIGQIYKSVHDCGLIDDFGTNHKTSSRFLNKYFEGV